MFVRSVLVSLALLSLVQDVDAQTATTTPVSGYTLDTPIETIAGDPAGAAVLNKDIPGLLTDPSYGIFKILSLKTIAALSHGDLDDQTLTQTEADLKALRTPAPSGQQLP